VCLRLAVSLCLFISLPQLQRGTHSYREVSSLGSIHNYRRTQKVLAKPMVYGKQKVQFVSLGRFCISIFHKPLQVKLSKRASEKL
jgi:hypothetical protein